MASQNDFGFETPPLAERKATFINYAKLALGSTNGERITEPCPRCGKGGVFWDRPKNPRMVHREQLGVRRLVRTTASCIITDDQADLLRDRRTHAWRKG